METKNQEDQKTKLAARITEPLEGRDEMNLIELPFALVSYRNKQGIKTIKHRWVGQDENGAPKQFYKIVTGSDQWGLPTFQAEEVLIAALELSYRKDFEHRKIHTNKYELLSLMNWPTKGSHYRKLLIEVFNQLLGVTIATNHFWDNTKQRYAETGFHILETYRFYDDEQKRQKGERGQLGLPIGYFTWSEELWKSLQSGFIKRLDTSVYFSLKSNLARRLYRYADKHLYQGGIEIDLFSLAFDKLVMRGNYKYPSKVIEKLKPAINELNNRKLVSIRIVESKTPSGRKVVIKPLMPRQRVADALDGISKQGTGETAPQAQISPSGGHSDTDQTLTDQLISRGISKGTAKKLVQEHGNHIVRSIEILDFLMENEKENITNPAGYLRRMIEEEWFLDKPPEGFVSKAEKEQRRRDREATEKKLMIAYQQDLGQALKDLDQLMALPLKDQVARQLESWKEFVRGYKGSDPSETMIAKREAELIEELEGKSREDRIASKRVEIIQQYKTLAEQQGIRDINFHAS